MPRTRSITKDARIIDALLVPALDLIRNHRRLLQREALEQAANLFAGRACSRAAHLRSRRRSGDRSVHRRTASRRASQRTWRAGQLRNKPRSERGALISSPSVPAARRVRLSSSQPRSRRARAHPRSGLPSTTSSVASLPSRDRADARIDPQQLRRVRGCRLQRDLGRNAGRDPELNLVLHRRAMQDEEVAGIRAGHERDAGLPGAHADCGRLARATSDNA